MSYTLSSNTVSPSFFNKNITPSHVDNVLPDILMWTRVPQACKRNKQPANRWEVTFLSLLIYKKLYKHHNLCLFAISVNIFLYLGKQCSAI
jgi:hypothetical protein